MKSNFLQRRSPMIILLGSAVFSCGKISSDESVSYRGKATETLRAASANSGVSPQLSLKGSLQSGDVTGQRLHQLRSYLNLEFEHMAALGLNGQEQLVFSMLLRDAQGQIVWENEQTSSIPVEELSWTPKVNGKEGEYTLELEVRAKTEDGKKTVSSYKSSFVLDTTLPLMAIEAKLSPINDEGLRDLSIATQIYNETQVQCLDASILHPSLTEAVSVKLNPIGADGRIVLNGKSSGLKAALANGNLLVKVNCKDAAGNQAELTQAAIPDGERAMSLAFKLDAKRGRELEASANAELRAFLSTPQLDFELSLLDPQTGSAHSEALIAAEKQTLRVYVTDWAPKSVDELLKSKTVLWTQLYGPKMKVALPANSQGPQTLYLSLLRHNLSENKTSLLASTALPLYIDGTGAGLKWTSGPGFAAPVKDSLLTLKGEVNIAGAPLSEALQAEYTLDGSAWKALPLMVKSLQGVQAEVQFAYPLANELPFRVRLKAQDLAGNISYSPSSSQIVARSQLPSLAVSAAERSACVSGSTPGAKLRPLLVSRYLCRKADALGQPVGNSHASLLLQNLGQVAPLFYSTSQISEGMGYKVIGDGQVIALGRMAPPDPFRLSSSEQRLLQFAISPTWLLAKRLEIAFDLEESDAYSTTNSCYPAEAPYPSVLLQDVDQGLSLQMSPFACDQEGLLP